MTINQATANPITSAGAMQILQVSFTVNQSFWLLHFNLVFSLINISTDRKDILRHSIAPKRSIKKGNQYWSTSKEKPYFWPLSIIFRKKFWWWRSAGPYLSNEKQDKWKIQTTQHKCNTSRVTFNFGLAQVTRTKKESISIVFNIWSYIFD